MSTWVNYFSPTFWNKSRNKAKICKRSKFRLCRMTRGHDMDYGPCSVFYVHTQTFSTFLHMIFFIMQEMIIINFRLPFCFMHVMYINGIGGCIYAKMLHIFIKLTKLSKCMLRYNMQCETIFFSDKFYSTP